MSVFPCSIELGVISVLMTYKKTYFCNIFNLFDVHTKVTDSLHAGRAFSLTTTVGMYEPPVERSPQMTGS